MNRPILLTMVVLAAPNAGEAAARGASKTPAGVDVLRDQAYGAGASQRLDLYTPTAAQRPLPLVVWIHGGAWRSGSRAQCTPPMSLLQASPTYAVASIDYRLSGEAVFPAQMEDCAAAVAWLHANAVRLGLDPTRTAVWGSSAGGHLATLAGLSGGRAWGATVMPRVQAVCDWYGPTDIIAMGQVPGYEKHARADSGEGLLLGGAPAERRELAALANPILVVDASDPPVLIAHGDQDPIVPPEQSRMLLAALQQSGVPAKLRVVAGAGHGGPEFNSEPEIAAVAAFLGQHLLGKAAAPAKSAAPAAAPAPGAPPAKRRPRASVPSSRPDAEVALQASPSAPAPAPVTAGADLRASPRSGALYFATYPERDNTAAIANPSIAGALFTVYWSDIERSPGVCDWEVLERRVAPWVAAGKCWALRIMWSASGTWPEPAARAPTPGWLIERGAVEVRHEASRSRIALAWDPLYRAASEVFIAQVAKRWDGDPQLAFVDVTPGAETNPYRFRRIDGTDPGFRHTFTAAAASDGRRYDDALWLQTVLASAQAADDAFKRTPVLVTLNQGGLGADRLETIGSWCVEHGIMVGQNGLTGRGFAEASKRQVLFSGWSRRVPVYLEMLDPSGPASGSLAEIVAAAKRAGAAWMGIYPSDALAGTSGQIGFDPARASALDEAARVLQAP